MQHEGLKRPKQFDSLHSTHNAFLLSFLKLRDTLVRSKTRTNSVLGVKKNDARSNAPMAEASPQHLCGPDDFLQLAAPRLVSVFDS